MKQKLNAKKIASEIIKLKSIYTLTSFVLPLVNFNDFFIYINGHGYKHGSTINLGKKDNKYYEGLDLYNSINLARKNDPQYNLDYLGIQLMLIISIIGDYLKSHDYFSKTPELEFFRHIRNAISHGNRFCLTKYKEPKRPAVFNNFVINNKLEGKPCLFDFMSTGDVFELLDVISNYLVNYED